MNKSERDHITCLQSEVKELRDALVGDQFQPNGLLTKQANLDKRLSRLERIVEGSKWFFAGAMALSTHSIYEIIQKLLAL